MANELILMAEPRTVIGKQVRALRREGLVPGVVYGPAVEGTVQVSVQRKELERFYLAHGHATLFTLQWNGGSQQVFIREVQEEPVRRAPLHVDFFAPNLLKELTARVPVVLHNASEHIEGILNQLLDEVEVRALPAELPHQIDADVSGLTSSHDSLRVSDLTLHGNVAMVTDGEQVIAMVIAQVVEEEPEVEEAEAAAEAAEGAADAETGETGATEASSAEGESES